MAKSGIFAALLVIGWSGASPAADIDYATLIDCTAGDSQAINSLSQYDGYKKTEKVNSYFSNWLLDDANYSQTMRVQFDWVPWSPDGPSLAISADDTVHNSIKILSRTDDSLIAATSASDRLTAEGWLFTVNFRQEEVIATQVQTNLAGVKGKVIHFNCTFDLKHREIHVPEATGDVG